MRRMTLTLIAFLLAGFAPMAVLGAVLWQKAGTEEAREVADARQRANDALAAIEERYYDDFARLIRAESARDFTEFQYWHAPEQMEAQAPALVRSVLARPPQTPLIKAYFQIVAGQERAEFQTPHVQVGGPQQQSETIETAVATATLRDAPAQGASAQAQAAAVQQEQRIVANDTYMTVQEALPALVEAAPVNEGTHDAERTFSLNSDLGTNNFVNYSRDALCHIASAPQPAEQKKVLNQTLAMNFNWQDVLSKARGDFNERSVSRNNSSRDYWTDLKAPPELSDLTAESTVSVYPYCSFHSRQDERDIWLFWRSVKTPVATLLQGFEVDSNYLRDAHLKEMLAGVSGVSLAALPAATPSPAQTSVIVDPADVRFAQNLRLAAPALPLAALADVSAIRADFASRRSTWAILAASYSLLLGALGLALQRTVSRRAALARQQEEFAAAVSHELRTPLSSIRLYAEMLEQQPVLRDSPAARRNVGQILSDQERLTRLVEMVLSSARVERGALTLRLAPMRIDEPLARAIGDAQLAWPGREIRWERRELPCAMLDGEAARQVFFNLLDNALKYSKEDGAPVEVTATIANDACHIGIRDHGCGIEAAEHRVLFKRFRRGQRANEFGAGTGLGLFLCDAYAKKMGWQVSVESDGAGRGAVAAVVVPITA